MCLVCVWVCVLSVELFNVFQLLCHRPILKWAREKDHESYPDFQTAKMEDTKFLDLNVQLGVPYLYQHQGNCEHIIIFTDIRSVKISWHPGLLVMVTLQFVTMMPSRTANVLVAMRNSVFVVTVCYTDIGSELPLTSFDVTHPGLASVMVDTV